MLQERVTDEERGRAERAKVLVEAVEGATLSALGRFFRR